MWGKSGDRFGDGTEPTRRSVGDSGNHKFFRVGIIATALVEFAPYASQ
jgi:hypothetical protein